MTNILEAIINIANEPILAIRSHYSGRNSANNVGEALEAFVKDAFADTIQIIDEQVRMTKYHQVFSWLGNPACARFSLCIFVLKRPLL